MNALPATEYDRLGPVSPELALVDPALRRTLQGMAQESTRPVLSRPSPRPMLVGQSAEGRGQADAPPASTRIPPSERRVGLVVVVIASAVAFVLGAKFAGSSELRPAQVASAYASQLPASQLPAPPQASHTLSGGSQRLEWAPVVGADGYEVAIYREGRRVYEARTPVPRLELSPSVRQELPRGILAWYVWPTRRGVRDGSPNVSSFLSSSSSGVVG
jgi:hypothetical protein